MASSSPEEKFRAAVKVIQTLPKNGSFQPSNELMLKFYAYFKQANLGSVNIPKPGFWDVVGRAKWDAWNKLGEMPREEAMLLYVEELKQIIEAMPHTQMVSDFVEKLGSFYEVVEVNDANVRNNNKMAILNGRVSNSIANRNASQKSANGKDSDPESEDEQEDEVTGYTSTATNGHAVAAETYRIPVKGQPHGAPRDIPNGDQEHAPLQNGHIPARTSRALSRKADSMTDSDCDEFCDTSDLPQASPSQSSHLDDLEQPQEDEECVVVTQTYGQMNALRTSNSPSAFQPVIVHDQMGDELDLNGSMSSTGTVTSSTHMLEMSNAETYPTSNQSLIPSDMLPADTVMTCGGGDDFPGRGRHQQQRSQSHQQAMNTQGRGGARGRDGVGRGGMQAAGGAGGGDRGSFNMVPSSGVNEQIAIALVRLQQDMNNVLSRLNTLEALTVAQHQVSRSRQSSESDRHERQLRSAAPWWWPFSNLSGQTVVIFLVWPLVVHWVLAVIRKRRHRLR